MSVESMSTTQRWGAALPPEPQRFGEFLQVTPVIGGYRRTAWESPSFLRRLRARVAALGGTVAAIRQRVKEDLVTWPGPRAGEVSE